MSTTTLTASDLCWLPQPATWPSSRPVLAIAVELLPTLTDNVTADLVEHLAHAIVDLEDELRAVRAVLSSALTMSHAHQAENVRLKQRVTGLLDERRRERAA